MTDTQNEVFKTPVNKIRLFEHGAPGSQNLKLTRKYYTEDMLDGRVKHIVQNITDPDIVPYIPDGIGNSTDRQRIPAVLIIPGGAFRRLVYNFEGEDVAKWLNSMGIAAFVLECRLPSDEHDNAEDVPLIDAMRAMRVIRGRAQEFGIDKAKIGVMGFSAGGFMAALLSTAYESDVYADYKYTDGGRGVMLYTTYPLGSLPLYRFLLYMCILAALKVLFFAMLGSGIRVLIQHSQGGIAVVAAATVLTGYSQLTGWGKPYNPFAIGSCWNVTLGSERITWLYAVLELTFSCILIMIITCTVSGKKDRI